MADESDKQKERMAKMILADKIIYLRKKSGWSQEQLAEQLDISRQSVSKWESGTSIPDLDKIIKMSTIFGVSTDYLLKDEIEEVTLSKEDITQQDNSRTISLEEANTYMDLARMLSKKIAVAISIFIFSPICLILLAGFSEYGNISLSENMALCIGIVILLLLVACGVSVLILTGMKLEKYEYLEKEDFSLQYGVEGIVAKRKEEFERQLRRSIVVGVVLCILSVVPLIIAATLEAGELAYLCCVVVLLFFVAGGVYQFVWSGTIQESFDKLLQEGDYTKKKKEANRRTGFFPGIYWCIITAIYLGISFTSNQWGKSWIIWPVAGVLFVAVMGIIQAVLEKSPKISD